MMFFVVGSRLPLVAGCSIAFLSKNIFSPTVNVVWEVSKTKHGGSVAKGEGRIRGGFFGNKKISLDPSPSSTCKTGRQSWSWNDSSRAFHKEKHRKL
jgi:hypothetical protein